MFVSIKFTLQSVEILGTEAVRPRCCMAQEAKQLLLQDAFAAALHPTLQSHLETPEIKKLQKQLREMLRFLLNILPNAIESEPTAKGFLLTAFVRIQLKHTWEQGIPVRSCRTKGR